MTRGDWKRKAGPAQNDVWLREGHLLAEISTQATNVSITKFHFKALWNLGGFFAQMSLIFNQNSIYWNSVFLFSFNANSASIEFPACCFSQLQVVFAHVDTFPVDRICKTADHLMHRSCSDTARPCTRLWDVCIILQEVGVFLWRKRNVPEECSPPTNRFLRILIK